MIFYLITRYEEYLPYASDQHGRFPATQSLAFRYDFLQQPLVNLLALKIKRILQKVFPALPFATPQFQYLPTFDIDLAWAYRHRGLFRTLGAYLKNLQQLDFKTLKRRLGVHFFSKKDPFYTFDFIEQLSCTFQLHPVFFFLLGDYGRFDKNIPPNNAALQALIKKLASNHLVGIHPSYQSNAHIMQLQTEVQRLSTILGKNIHHSRQHFLKLHLPTTYQNLIKVGIQQDYTMGYADQIGFRASIATPYRWYDLSREQATNLKIVPFQVMDVTLREYLKLSPQKAVEAVVTLLKTTQKVNGTFVTLWHNNSLGETEGWEGWRVVFEKIVTYVSDC